jgi:hypothetical protein
MTLVETIPEIGDKGEQWRKYGIFDTWSEILQISQYISTQHNNKIFFKRMAGERNEKLKNDGYTKKTEESYLSKNIQ